VELVLVVLLEAIPHRVLPHCNCVCCGRPRLATPVVAGPGRAPVDVVGW
jgi:hypothetical protein